MLSSSCIPLLAHSQSRVFPSESCTAQALHRTCSFSPLRSHLEFSLLRLDHMPGCTRVAPPSVSLRDLFSASYLLLLLVAYFCLLTFMFCLSPLLDYKRHEGRSMSALLTVPSPAHSPWAQWVCLLIPPSVLALS